MCDAIRPAEARRPERPTRLVLCLGNDLRSDDGVGWRVAESLQGRDLPRDVEVRTSALSGFYLLDEMIGFNRVVIVDAIRSGVHPPGTIHSVPLERIASPDGPSPHSVGLPTVMATAARCGVPLPQRVHVVAVEAKDMETIGTRLTSAVEGAVPGAVGAVLKALAEDTEGRVPKPHVRESE